MRIYLSRLIHAPIETVFAVFDDPSTALDVGPHATAIENVTVEPDGRQTYDIVMRSESMEWRQTIEQVVREPPFRLVTRGWTWTTDRSRQVLVVTNGRRFSTESDDTRVDAAVEARLVKPIVRPVQAVRNWLWRGATQVEYDQQLALIAQRIERNLSG